MNIKTLSTLKKVFLAVAAICFCLGAATQGCSSASHYSMTKDYGDIKWPDTPLVNRLPEPESKYGKVMNESSDAFSVRIGKTSRSQFDNYVDACMDKGFTVDYSKGSNSFDGDDDAGFSVSLFYYDDDNTMSISIDAPSVDDESASSNVGSSSSSASVASSTTMVGDGVTPSFKEAMDSYEVFFDEYCAFMEKYANSDEPMSMAADYARFMSQYAETMGKMNAIDEGSLSPADYAYYMEVMTRVNQKLANAPL